jgi:hypothetical protein
MTSHAESLRDFLLAGVVDCPTGYVALDIIKMQSPHFKPVDDGAR